MMVYLSFTLNQELPVYPVYNNFLFHMHLKERLFIKCNYIEQRMLSLTAIDQLYSLLYELHV